MRQVFREFMRRCREFDIYGRELVAVDGTRIKAVNNANRTLTRAKRERELKSVEERVEHYVKQMAATARCRICKGRSRRFRNLARP